MIAPQFAHMSEGDFPFSDDQLKVINYSGRRLIVAANRQWGKTTVAAEIAARAAEAESASIFVLEPNMRMARECFRKIKGCLVRGAPGLRYLDDNKTSCELENGARIVVVPARGENICGFSNPYVVIIDDAAFVVDEDYQSVRPMLSHSGRLILLSTPNGREGFFWRIWESNTLRFAKMLFRGTSCPHVRASFLAEERKHLGKRWYAQEYDCKFLKHRLAYYDRAKLKAVFADAKDEAIC